jgi:uncharacterized membrane protein
VGYAQLTKIARLLDATIRLDYRPGHFIVAGQPIAKVFPQGAAKHSDARPRLCDRSVGGNRHPSTLPRGQ